MYLMRHNGPQDRGT